MKVEPTFRGAFAWVIVPPEKGRYRLALSADDSGGYGSVMAIEPLGARPLITAASICHAIASINPSRFHHG